MKYTIEQWKEKIRKDKEKESLNISYLLENEQNNINNIQESTELVSMKMLDEILEELLNLYERSQI